MKKLGSEKIEKINGGAQFRYAATNDVNLSQKEYDFLVKKGFIESGKLKHSECIKAMECLKEEGYNVTSENLCFMYLGYKPPEFAKLTISLDLEEALLLE